MLFNIIVAGLAWMLIAAAVTLGKLWGAEPHVSPSTEYTGAQTNELARYGSFTLFLTMLYYQNFS